MPLPTIEAIERFLRPRDWAPYLGLPVLGWAASQAKGSPAAALLWSTLYLAAGYGFNSVCDARMDLPGKNSVADGRIGRRAAFGISLSLFAASAALAALRLGGRAPLAFSMIALGIVYSLPRVGIKRVPVAGSLANLWLFVPLFWIGAGAAPFTQEQDLWYFALLGFPSLQSQLVHESQDEAEDARAGVRTTAQLLGVRRIAFFVGALSLASAVAAWGAMRAGGLSPLVAAAFAVSAALAALPQKQEEGRFLHWRRRIQGAYSAVCALWLATLLSTRFFG